MIDHKKWKRHFTKEPRSTETVAVPKDVFDFLLETNEAYVALDGGDVAVVVACQLMALDLLREVADHNRAPEAPM